MPLNPINDSNPPLAVRAVPPHREPYDNIGRLYRKPDFQLPSDFQSLPTLKQLIRDGHLMPSITNVIGVRSSPFLLPWATKLTAETAINAMQRWKGDILDRPDAAIKWIKKAADREKEFWGNQGTRIHTACELLALNQPIQHLNLTKYETDSVEQWKKWLDTFQPEFNFLELTGFGTTSSGLHFAGTADFNATINGVNMLGDYKCVTDETYILLADGTQIQAQYLTEGASVVAWSPENGLHSAPVSYVGSNGEQTIVRITTDKGQVLECTTNHPVLSNKQNWTNAEDLKAGDSVFLASGWDYSHHRTENPYPYNKHLSPYLLGMLWSLSKYAEKGWNDDAKGRWKFDYPKGARGELFEELSSFGFLLSKDNKLRVKVGLQRVAKKTRISVEELLSIINTITIPTAITGAPLIYQQAFISGVQEVFANKAFSKDYFFVEAQNVESLHALQQMYLNLGEDSQLGANRNTKRPLLKLPFQVSEHVRAFGTEHATVASVKVLPGTKHTVAIEVAGAHTHVTNGLITHNTNRSGLHADIGLQLAANRKVNKISPDNTTLIDAPEVDMTVGVHISPAGVKMVEVDTSDSVYDTFEALRKTWDFHAFDGGLHDNKGVFLRTIKTKEDI